MQNQPSSRTACQAEHPWLLPKELYKKTNPKKKSPLLTHMLSQYISQSERASLVVSRNHRNSIAP
jgi:hypothetical protein